MCQVDPNIRHIYSFVACCCLLNLHTMNYLSIEVYSSMILFSILCNCLLCPKEVFTLVAYEASIRRISKLTKTSLQMQILLTWVKMSFATSNKPFSASTTPSPFAAYMLFGFCTNTWTHISISQIISCDYRVQLLVDGLTTELCNQEPSTHRNPIKEFWAYPPKTEKWMLTTKQLLYIEQQ